MKRPLIIFVILGVIILAALYYFWSQRDVVPADGNLAPVAANVLDDAAYQQTVLPLLESLIQAPEATADPLAQIVSHLAELAVNANVKDDHLLLFSSLDALRQYRSGSTAVRPDVIRQRLELFAQHRDWAREPIAHLVSQLPTI